MARVNPDLIIEKKDRGEQLSPDEVRYMSGIPGPEDLFEDKPSEPTPKPAETPSQTPEENKDSDSGGSDKPVQEEVKAEVPKTAETEKKEAEPTVEKEVVREEFDQKKVLAELEKPEEEQDIESLNRKEKGLFFELKHQRRRAREAEEERDRLRLEIAQDRTRAKIKDAEPDKEPEAPDVEDDDVLTGKDVKKLLAKQINSFEERQQAMELVRSRQMNEFAVRFWQDVARTKHADFDDVMKWTDEKKLVEKNPAYKEELTQTLKKGGNLALKLYEIAVNDPDYKSKIEAEKEKAEKTAQATKDAEKIKANSLKTKTTGNISGGDSNLGTQIDEMSAEDFVKLSFSDLMAMPSKRRERLLELYG